MEFMLTELFNTDDWYNVYHATISDDNDVYGSRIPGIWVHMKDGITTIRIHIAINEYKNHFADAKISSVEVNKWIAINVSQSKIGGDYHFKYEMNGTVIYTEKNTKPRQYENVTIYISDPWYSPVPGYIRNVYLKGKV